MQVETIKKILLEVKTGLKDIFGNNMLFGFVCGGFSKGYADENHDVDIFVCIENELSDEIKKKYYLWYFNLHKHYNLNPDYDYPGEIVTRKDLIEALNILNDLKLTLKIDDVKIKKAIIWADMITGQTASEIGGDLPFLYKLKNEYCRYPEQWKNEVLSLINPEEKEIWKNKSHLLIMEHFMKYPKNDGKKLEKIYG